MGLFGRLFGLGLVLAGLFIALYWTLWTLMIVVSKQENKSHSHIAIDRKAYPKGIALVLFRPSVALPSTGPGPYWWHRLYQLVYC